MALLRKLNTKAAAANNTGYGNNAANYGGRFINKNGKANIEKRGINILERTSWYHTMLALSKWKFLFVIFGFYGIANLLFAVIYYVNGVEHLAGMETANEFEKFWEAFFFSAQTITTVGYGRISPSGFLINSIAAFEALIGVLSLALGTGLLYARFSKPTAHLKFSYNAIIAPYKNGTALMFRLAPYKNITLTDAEAKLTLGMVVEENGNKVNRFYQLPLELDKINSLTLSWTIVHPINEESPLYNFTEEDFKNNKGEFLVFIKSFDDMFSTTVVARSSYIFNEVVFGAQFIPMYQRNSDDDSTILEIDKLNSFNNVVLS